MRRTVRTTRALALCLLSAGVAACAVATEDETVGRQAEAVTIKCPTGTVPDASGTRCVVPGQTSTPKPTLKCAPGWLPNVVSGKCIPTAVSMYTSAPSPQGTDLCGSTQVPIPSGLPATCSLGTMVNGQPIWACPPDTVVPPTLGVAVPDYATCPGEYVVPPEMIYKTCGEHAVALTKVDSNCIGAPLNGWILVKDEVDTIYCAGHPIPTGPLPVCPADGEYVTNCPGQCIAGLKPNAPVQTP